MTDFKYILIALFAIAFITLISCASQKNGNTEDIRVVGKIMHTQNYCGGAAPPAELIKKYRTPSPLSDLTLYIKKGTINDIKNPVIKEVITDANGEFSTTLPSGEYILLLPSQLNRDIFTPQKDLSITDEDKLNEWWNAGVAQINSNSTNIELKLHKKCEIPLGVPNMRFTGLAKP